MIGAGEEYRGEAIEGELAVRCGIGDGRTLRRGLERRRIGLAVAERAEQREAERAGPHVEAAECDPEIRAETRPQRFGIAHFPKIGPDRGRAPCRFVVRKLVVGAAGLECGGDVLGRQHA